MTRSKVIRTSTVPVSLDRLLKGQLRFLDQEFEVVAVSGEGEHLRNVESREGVRVFPIEMQRQISPLKDLVSLWKLYRFFKKEKPQIVHSITPKAGLLSMMAAWLARVPVRVHTFTGLIFPSKTGMMQKILILMDKMLCRFATTIYPEGQGVKNDLIRYRITSKPLQIIANGNVNGIDTSYFNPEIILTEEKLALRNQLGISETDFIFIFVGRLVKDKGINELVAAFGKLAENEKIHLVLLGRFEQHLDPISPETVATIESHPKIHAVGFQEDVRKYLATADAFVFPSYREGFPNVVMQAGAMGLPCIVTDINGCNEIIIGNQNGIIIPPKDQIALYEAMQKFVADAPFLSQLQSQARQMIVSRYEQNTVWDAILKEYRNFGTQL